MINVNMIDKAGVTLATAGKYCADNVKVTPSEEILRKDEQAKTATPTTSAQDITPDAGKALSKVTVNPITAAIVGNLDASSFAGSIVAAVEGKGVTVPDGTLLDGMASLIDNIEAGGGGNIVAGTYTPASTQTNRVTITHNLGKKPTGVLFAKYHTEINNGADTVLFLWQSGGYGIRYFVYTREAIVGARLSISGANSQVHAQNHSNTDIVCGLTETTFQTPKNLYAGTYIWAVFGEVLK